MARLIYPSLQQPVLDASQQAEAVSYDRWHQQLSEPVRFRMLPAMAAVLAIASGQVFSPDPIENDDPSTFEIWRPFHDPVRVRPELAARLQQTAALTHAPPFEETVLEDKYHQALSEPIVKSRPRLAEALQQTSAFTHAAPYEETVSFDRWLYALSEPVRVPPRLIVAAQEANWLVQGGSFAETVLIDKYLYRFNEPVRLPPRLHAAQNPHLFYRVAGNIVPLPDNYWRPLNEPVRLPRRVQVGGQPDLFYRPGVIFTGPDHYMQAFGEPRRFLPRIQAALYHTTALTQVLTPNVPLNPRRRMSLSVNSTG